MSSSATGGDALGRAGDEASPSVSPSIEGVLPIRGVDGSTGEAIPIDAAPSLREADDPFRADVVRWAALDVPSIIVEEDLKRLREAYRIPADIELMLPGPNERACFLRRGCTALHLTTFVSRMRLPLYPMFRRILRTYGLAPTQVAPNGWSQMRVVDDPEPDLDVPSFYGIARSSQPKKKAVELVDNYADCAPQPLQRTLSVNPSGNVVLDCPPRVDPVSGGPGVGPFDSRNKLREMISDDTLLLHGGSGCKEVLYPQVGGVHLARGVGGRVGGWSGYSC
ncbi:Uncharacterized protein Adt_02016 [Abeliophyllum distichum]|uniref:Transposase (putative) gypsy type domain-containing protein n=1 Tax=Abeliophyllum distichum TaxID=126358 RepID=A0ABD1VWX1_9LAMI